eukprot:TRINITY_DN68683_c0_g1_i1.p1 TRINITY_DN68683_c0_g1~~TRINITY_DN68683_c0_g1_i1.p1  ORF type:complete len:262 (-),score=-0.44 TRINITY_DN68683_c0_g1_i1:110-895(-)
MSESIYNLVQKEYIIPEKEPIHVSKHDPLAELTGSTFGCHGTTRLPGAGSMVKKAGANFGPRLDDRKPTGTKHYLKKKAAEEVISPNASTLKHKESRKDAIPDRNSQPVMGIRTTKNFVTANAVEAILAAPKVIPVAESNYMKKEDYGKIPAYLKQVKEEIRRENDMIDQYVKARMGVEETNPEHIETFDEQDRQDLLSQLKAKWDVTNANYQRMTHLVKLDSCGKIRRKTELENTLKALEADIEKLSRPGNILVRHGYSY